MDDVRSIPTGYNIPSNNHQSQQRINYVTLYIVSKNNDVLCVNVIASAVSFLHKMTVHKPVFIPLSGKAK